MPFRRPPYPALALVIVALLAAPAAAPISDPRIIALSPVPEISVSEKDGTVTGQVSGTGHILWESTQADGLPAGISVGDNEWQEPDERKAAAFAGHHLAIETRFESGNPHYPGDRRRITVIDALTGLPAWSILSGYPSDGRARPFFYLVGTAAGKIIIDIPALRTIRALDPRDGTPLWEAGLPGDCVSTALPSAEPRAADGDFVQSYSRADDRLVVAVTRCADRHTSLTGLDPATGRVRWEHRLPPAGPAELSLEEGVSILNSPSSLTIVDESGLILADDLVRPSPSWVVMAGAVVVADGEWGGAGAGVRSISRSSGRVIWSRPDLPGWVGTASGKIFVNLEDTLTVLDPADGRTLTTLSAPLTEKDVKTALTAPPGWGARAGVPAADWPDACALLPPAELASRSGTGGYTPTPIAAPPGLGLNTPLGCELTPRGRGTLVTVSVVRVHPSVQDALAQMGGGERTEGAARVSRHAVYIDSEKDSILIREGRVIVRVEAYGDRALLRHAGRITGERLRELYPPGKGPR